MRCVTLLLAGGVLAAPLPVESIVSLALERAELRAALATDADHASALEALPGVWPNPELELAHEQAGDDSEQAAVLSQRFDVSGRRGRLQAAARERARAVALRGEAARQEVAAAVRARCSEVVHAQARHAVLVEWRERLGGALRTIAQREAAGEASAYDRGRLERELRGASVEVELVEVDREAAWLRLTRLAGELPEGDWPRLVAPALPEPPAGDPNERPSLQALDAEAVAAGMEREAASRRGIPGLGLSAGWKSVATQQRSHGFVAALSVELPVFDGGGAEGDAARADQARLRARLALSRSQAAAEVTALRREVTLRIALARRFRAEGLGASATLARIAEVAYAGGELDLLELLDAHRGVTEDALRALRLERAARDAVIALRAATGRSVE